MKALTVLAFVMAFAGLPAGAQELTKKAKIERILTATKADSMVNQMFEQMKAILGNQIAPGASEEQRAKAKELTTRVMDVMKERINWDKMRPDYVKLYDETYTESEINGILAFYESPAGRSMIEKMPVLMSKSMVLAQRWMQDLMPEVQKIAEEAARGVK